jgi:acyl-coenzyme A thioesterase PaaI-like protein
VAQVRITGRVVRHGRSQIFTDARIEDAADPARLLGYGTTCFAVSGPAPESVQFGHDPMPPTGRSITDVYGGVPRPDGGFDIPALTPELGHGRLHSGVMMVLAEAAAHEAARRQRPEAKVRTQHLGITVATSGRAGPFRVVPDLLGAVDGSGVCAVEVLDDGDGGRLVAVVTVGLRV